MRLADYVDQDALGLAELVRGGEISAAELAETAAAACAAVDPEINAVVELWPPEPPQPGAAAAFAGVPFLIKDAMLRMAGRRCEIGSRLAAGLVSSRDSTLMARFRAAGLVTIGRTAVPELTCSLATEPVLTGATRNPWDRALSTGGSSGGAAAAVAAGIVPIAHANDAGGSIRSPAAWCGLFGLKPSRGRVPVGPDIDEAMFGMAVELAVSRSVRDSAALLDAVEGPASGDPFAIARPVRSYREESTRDPGRLRIGLMAHGLGGERTEPQILAALDRVARACEALGHEVAPADLDLGLSWEAFMTGNARIWLPALAAGITALAQATGRPIDDTMLEPATLAYYHYGRTVDAIGFQQALAMRNTAARALGGWFERYDILLSPTMPTAPPPIGVLQPGPGPIDAVEHIAWLFGFTPFTPLTNLVGVPAMTMPLAHDEARDLPIGLHFAAAFGREDRLFRLAGQLERAMPWRQRRPAINAGRQQGTRP